MGAQSAGALFVNAPVGGLLTGLVLPDSARTSSSAAAGYSACRKSPQATIPPPTTRA